MKVEEATCSKLVEALKRLKKKGFAIALDDYIYNPSHKPIVALADIIKIDITQLNQKQLIEHVKILGKYKAKLLAEKVETLDEFEFCEKLGFDFYQGYFLSKPRIIKSKSLPSNKLAVVNLLSVLQNPNSELENRRKKMVEYLNSIFVICYSSFQVDI